MECNREELRITAGGGPSQRVSFSAEKKNSWEAWAGPHLRCESQAPIAEGFSHRAFPSDSAHALPGTFSSLPLSRRALAPKLRTHLTLLPRAASGPDGSLLALAWSSVYWLSLNRYG